MTTERLPTLETGVRDAARATVIWLHGLGADGHDFEPIVPELRLPDRLGVRFVFPHAPSRPVTLNGGMSMPAWYDIIALGGQGPQDDAGIRASAKQIQDLMLRENERGVPDERIVLAGFSQGGAIALHLGVRHPRRIAGIMALSTYLPLLDTVAGERSPANVSTPILMCHGTLDPVIEPRMGDASREALEALGSAVDWHSYPMAHQVCMEEIDEIGRWLKQVLA